MIYYSALSWRKEGSIFGTVESWIESPITYNIMKLPDHFVNHMIRGGFTSGRFLSVIGNTTLVTFNVKNNFSKSVATPAFRWAIVRAIVQTLNARNWNSTVNNREPLIYLVPRFRIIAALDAGSRPFVNQTRNDEAREPNRCTQGNGQLNPECWVLWIS